MFQKSAIGEYCLHTTTRLTPANTSTAQSLSLVLDFVIKFWQRQARKSLKRYRIQQISKSKPKSKDKDQAKAKTQPTLTRTTIERCLKSLTKEFQYSDEVDSITTVKVMESLGLTR